jgi:hypothetical protein
MGHDAAQPHPAQERLRTASERRRTAPKRLRTTPGRDVLAQERRNTPRRNGPGRHARLASGWWPTFAGRDSYPQGCIVRFRSWVLQDVLLTLAFPGAQEVQAPLPSQRASLHDTSTTHYDAIAELTAPSPHSRSL